MSRIIYSHRKELVSIIDEMNFQIVAELGVASGDFSSVLIKSKLKELILIDKWNDHHNEKERQFTINRFKGNERVKIIHDTFENASNEFTDGYFDFIYIDGYAHTGQDAGRTLDIWWPKVKSGGFFGGHDYHKNYPLTINVVNKLCDFYKKDLYLTGEERFPSWYVFK